ncbi:MAG: ribonuclease P protein component [Candidatus Firestonebacteria bacterium]
MFDSLKRNEIKKIFSEGLRYKGKQITILVQERKDALLKFGVALVGKSESHERNKIKRRIRAIIRSNAGEIKKGRNIIILTSTRTLNLKYQELQKIILEQLKCISI